MKRLTLRLAISLVTFAAGIAATAIYLTRPATDDFTPPAVKLENSAAPSPAACFPGYSKEVKGVPTKRYFPPGAFYSNPEHEAFVREWYEKFLRAMNETSLLARPDAPAESYRFLWLRTFDRPLSVRVWRSADGQFLNVRQLSGAGGYEPGELITNETRPLTSAEWDEFNGLLDRACYWQLPAKDDRLGHDGAQWILEGRRDGRYHVVDRWAPKDGDFREACLYLLKLSNLGLDLSADDVY